MGRIVWNVAYIFLFRISPKPLHAWRSFILRSFGAKIGKGVHVYPAVKIWAPWNLEIGDQTGIANNVILYSQGKIIIGKRAVISQGAHLCAGTHDYTKRGFPLITMPIYIEDEAWIAAEAFLHPGVTVGKGVIVGARSVVNKNLPELMICAGNPCRPLKPRPPIEENESMDSSS